MLREIDASQQGVVALDADSRCAAVRNDSAQKNDQPSESRAAPSDYRSVEQEISRLTWLVLDGAASLADRRRLADLVKLQHRQRRSDR